MKQFRILAVDDEQDILDLYQRVLCPEKSEAQSTLSELDALAEGLGHFHHLDPARIRPYLYSYPNDDAVRHILRVAGGLDSMILGEPQILGQMKEAYQAAADAGTLRTALSRLFQHTFSVAKQIRTDTAIGESPVSVAFAAVSLAKQIFSDFEEHTALLIGAGETIELSARHLNEQKLGRLVVANRTIERAHRLAADFNGYGISLEEIPAHLAEADIVISATASSQPVVTREMVRRALKSRKHRPVFMVDIAVPRDIDPAVAELEAGLFLADRAGRWRNEYGGLNLDQVKRLKESEVTEAVEKCRKAGIDRKQVFAVGNDYNDMDMLHWAERGFLVENSPPELKPHFELVASNEAGGVAEAIERWLKGL